MPTQPIPFQLSQETSAEQLGGGSPVSVNVIVDGRGTVRRRPGLSGAVRVDAGKAMGSVYVTDGGRRYVVGVEPGLRTVYRVLGAAVNDIGQLPGIGRPVFAETPTHVIMAGGDKMMGLNIAADTMTVVSGDAQCPRATHVIANATRLLANDPLVDPNIVRFSDTVGASAGPFADFGLRHWNVGDRYPNPTGDPLNPTIYSTAGVFMAEAKPDRVMAVAEDSNEVYVFGREVLEIWTRLKGSGDFVADYNRGEWFAEVIAAEYGCSAPYGVVRVDGAFAWLDKARRVVLGDGRRMSVISDPIQAVLDSMTTVEDCYGFRIMTDPIDAIVWVFPTDGRALVYCPGQGWCQWMGWSGGTWAPLKFTGHAFDPTTAEDIVTTSDGYLATVDMNAATDVEDMIPASITTGFIDRGSSKRKRCRGIRVALRRGSALDPSTVVQIRFRDDLGPWSDPLSITLGVTGDTTPVVPLNGLGYYRTRQWKFDFTGTEALSLVGVTEDYEELEM